MKIKGIILVLLALLVFVPTVLASSSTFFTQAKKYIDRNCSKDDISNQVALLCYLFEKSNEADKSLTNLGSRVDKLESSPSASKKFILLDSNNQELGQLVQGFQGNEYKVVYNQQLNRLVTLHPSTGQVYPGTTLFYVTNNCTADAYLSSAWAAQFNDFVFRVGNSNSYAEVDANSAPASITALSFNDGVSCQSDNELFNNARKVQIVSLPFSAPSAPFHIKFQ